MLKYIFRLLEVIFLFIKQVFYFLQINNMNVKLIQIILIDLNILSNSRVTEYQYVSKEVWRKLKEHR